MNVRLGDICRFLNGGTPSRSVSRYFEGDIPWITGSDIISPVVSSARSHITCEAIQNSATNRVPAGTVLLVTRTSVGKVAIAGIDLCFSQDITALIPDSQKIDAPYLVHFLRTQQSYFERLSRGATIKGVTREVVENLDIPLPPLLEQRRIADILDKADSIRRKRQRAIARMEDFLRSVFLEMFGDPVTNSKAWVSAKLGDICNFVSGGTPSKAHDEYWNGSFPWVSPKDMKRLEINNAEDHISDLAFRHTSIKKIPKGSILIVVRGMILAHTVPLAITTDTVAINQDIKAILPINGIAPEFLLWTLMTQHDYILGKVATAAHGTKRLEMLELSALPIIIPPLENQKNFVNIHKRLKNLRNSLYSSKIYTEKLFYSLTNLALYGELTNAAADEIFQHAAAN